MRLNQNPFPHRAAFKANQNLSIALTASQKQDTQERADAAGLSKGSYIRACLSVIIELGGLAAAEELAKK